MSLLCSFCSWTAADVAAANHLDLPAILWLEHHLLNSVHADTQTVVIVSHDRNFLDTVTTETIIFKDKQLKYHAGNYDDWESTTEEQRKRKMRLKEVRRYFTICFPVADLAISWTTSASNKSRPASRRTSSKPNPPETTRG